MSLKRKKRTNLRYYVRFTLIAVGLWFAWGYLQGVFKEWSFFNVAKIEVTGNVNLNPLFLQQQAADFVGTNLLSLKKDEVAMRYQNIIRVQQVQVKKHYPKTLEVVISERQAAICLKTADGQLIPLASDATILDTSEFYPGEDVPCFEVNLSSTDLKLGHKANFKSVDQIMHLHNALSQINKNFVANISEYLITSEGYKLIESSCGARLLFGQNDQPENLQKLVQRFMFLKQNVGLQPGIEFDLRYNNQVVARGSQS